MSALDRTLLYKERLFTSLEPILHLDGLSWYDRDWITQAVRHTVGKILDDLDDEAYSAGEQDAHKDIEKALDDECPIN